MKKRKCIMSCTGVALTAVMAFSLLTGCGGKSTDTAAGTGQSAQVSNTSGGPFDFEKVSDVKFPLEEKLTLDVFVYAAASGGGTYQDNYATDWIEEQTNIHLNFIYDVDGDDAKTKLNLVMTDPDNLPDIFFATGWSKSETQSYAQQGMILPLDDYLKDAPNWNAMNEISPARKADLVMSDGKTYVYGDENECYHCLYQNRMWIYKPWVDKLLGGKMPETTEELYQFMKAVKEQDPNGNGKQDEIPMTGFTDGWASDPAVWIMNSFIQCNNPLSNTNPTVAGGFVINEGKIEYNVVKDQYKEGLRYINKLYKEGLLDSQVYTQTETQCAAALNNEDGNLVALHPGGIIFADKDNFIAGKEGEWQNWVALDPVEGPEGVRLAAKGITNYFATAQGIVTPKCEYPVIAVALFDFMCSEEATMVGQNGPEGFGWIWTDEGTSLGGGTPKYQTFKMEEDFDWLANGFEKEYKNRNYVSDASFKNQNSQFRSDARILNPELSLSYTVEKAAESYSKYSPEDSSLVPNLVFNEEEARQISEYTMTIGSYVNQAAVQFITGAMDIDKDWDSYIDTLNGMGLDNYISVYQKAYDSYNANAQ